jgi:hypothetical protein
VPGISLPDFVEFLDRAPAVEHVDDHYLVAPAVGQIDGFVELLVQQVHDRARLGAGNLIGHDLLAKPEEFPSEAVPVVGGSLDECEGRQAPQVTQDGRLAQRGVLGDLSQTGIRPAGQHVQDAHGPLDAVERPSRRWLVIHSQHATVITSRRSSRRTSRPVLDLDRQTARAGSRSRIPGPPAGHG